MPKKVTSKLSSSLKWASRQQKPLWKGPHEDGITQSMLSDFIVCRERFRIKHVLGLQPKDDWEHKKEYGHLWHKCEEVWATSKDLDAVLQELNVEVRKMCKQHKGHQKDVVHWGSVCRTQFPIYLEYWKTHKEERSRVSVLQEVAFRVPYTLPSRREVLLRGRWDGVDLLGGKRNGKLYNQENKSKGDPDEEKLVNQLTCDLQTMLYSVALQAAAREEMYGLPNRPLGGVRYNVIRRPLSGGKGSIRKWKNDPETGKPETDDHYYGRLADYILEDPDFYFKRWRVDFSPGDIEQFQSRVLNPLLDQLCDWWEHITSAVDPFHRDGYTSPHWQTPFGVWNNLLLDRPTEYDYYLRTGSTAGLKRAKVIFPELED